MVGSAEFVNEPWSGEATFLHDTSGFIRQWPHSTGDIPLKSSSMTPVTMGGTTFSTANANVVGSYSGTGNHLMPGNIYISGTNAGSAAKTDGTPDFLINLFDPFVESYDDGGNPVPV